MVAFQFYTKSAEGLAPDGEEVVLAKGDVDYVEAGRIHDAKYLEDYKLVYVHDKAFGYNTEGQN